MKKAIPIIVMAVLCIFLKISAQTVQQIKIIGKVMDENGVALPGANVKIIQINKTVITNNDGEFILSLDRGEYNLSVNSLNHKVRNVQVKVPLDKKLIIELESNNQNLKEVEIVSTGYQAIPKERATGAFTQIDNTLINRSVSTNILDRLDGVTSGLIFTKATNPSAPHSNIEIRGRSTLFSSAEPLIIVDNFPYDGDLNNINPNDVENITVLKDAAAAAAWGSRSGNGVIVITTKKGTLNTKPKINFNFNIGFGGKPDLYYLPQLSSSEYIEVEQFLFNKKTYDSNIEAGYIPLSPAVEIFQAKRSGLISESDSISRINALKGYDSRKQLLQYYYRPSMSQQYQVNTSGGGEDQKYFVSVGYDRNLNNDVTSNYNRMTLNANNTYYLLNKKLEFFTDIVYTSSKTKSGQGSNSTSYPYDQFADANNNPMVMTADLRPSYIETVRKNTPLDWLNRPLNELINNYGNSVNNLTDYRINTSLNYRVFDGIRIIAFYTYEQGNNEINTLHELDSYYTRNKINTYSQIDATIGSVIFPIPLGAILDKSTTSIQSHNGRFQINYDNTWKSHSVSAIAGTEIRDFSSVVNTNILYGYDPETASNQNASINYNFDFPYSYGYMTGRISPGISQLGVTNRFFSYYFNGSYTYENKYIASISVRRDESNLFGVATNQKGVPLWSAGVAWVINKEAFYNLDWLSALKLRVTQGYTGNVNNTISAYLTTKGGDIFQYYNAYATRIISPPNPSLRWEKVKNVNIGVDFVLKNNRLNGSIDMWRKVGLDLIGNSPIAPQTGIMLYTGNSANTLTQGIDIQLNSINFNGHFKWTTSFNYNHSLSRVTNYKVNNGTNFDVVSANYNNPLEGYPYYALFSFKYAGLDASGNPQGYLDGKVSEDYTAIQNSTNRKELVYSGSTTPTSFGNVRNTFLYKSFDLSFNIIYKFGYYFRKTSLQNSILYNIGSVGYKMSDYDRRWQKTGDEAHTKVPALIYPGDSNRDAIYTYSDALVLKGDQVRLQDFRLGFTLNNRESSKLKPINLFISVNNIGILWKYNNENIDPDALASIPLPRTITLGLKVNL